MHMVPLRRAIVTHDGGDDRSSKFLKSSLRIYSSLTAVKPDRRAALGIAPRRPEGIRPSPSRREKFKGGLRIFQGGPWISPVHPQKKFVTHFARVNF